MRKHKRSQGTDAPPRRASERLTRQRREESPMQDLLVDDVKRLLISDYLPGAHGLVFSMTCKAYYSMYREDDSHRRGRAQERRERTSCAVMYILDGYTQVSFSANYFISRQWADTDLTALITDDRAADWFATAARWHQTSPTLFFRCMGQYGMTQLLAKATPINFVTVWTWVEEWLNIKDLSFTALEYLFENICANDNMTLLRGIAQQYCLVDRRAWMEWFASSDAVDSIDKELRFFQLAGVSVHAFHHVREVLAPLRASFAQIAHIVFTRTLGVATGVATYLLTMLRDLGETPVREDINEVLRTALRDDNVALLEALLVFCPFLVSIDSVCLALRWGAAKLLRLFLQKGAPLPTEELVFTTLDGRLDYVAPGVLVVLIEAGFRVRIGSERHARVLIRILESEHGDAHLVDAWTRTADPASAFACLHRLTSLARHRPVDIVMDQALLRRLIQTAAQASPL